MRQHIQASVALKTFSGMHFGTARWVQADRIAFATDAKFTPGDRAEMRMELSGQYSAVLAEVLVVRTYKIDEKGEIGCIAQIMDMPDADAERLNNWLADLTEGGVGAQPSAWLQSMLNYQSSGPTASPEETRSALDRINRRMERSKSFSRSKSRSFTSTANQHRGGREAIREVLKATFAEEEAEARTPSAGPRLVSTPPVENKPEPPKTEPVNGALLTGETNGLQCEFDGARITVRWNQKADLKASWNDGLKVGTLELPLAGASFEPKQAVGFQFHLPDGQILALRGRIIEAQDTTVSCTLNVPWGARIKLQSASKP